MHCRAISVRPWLNARQLLLRKHRTKYVYYERGGPDKIMAGAVLEEVRRSPVKSYFKMNRVASGDEHCARND